MNKLLSTAVAVALCSSAYAAPLTQKATSTITSINSTVSDATADANAVSATVTRAYGFNQGAYFNPNTGVLIDVSSALALSSQYGGLTLSATGTRTTNGGTAAFSGQGSVTATLTLPGLSWSGAINDTLSISCSSDATCFPNGPSQNLSATTSLIQKDTTWYAATGNVSASSLNSYVGVYTYQSTLAVTPSVRLISEDHIQTPSAKLQLSSLTGTHTLTYSYLKHANASFSSSTDTDTIARSAGPGFTVFNLGDGATTKLDLLEIQCVSGDCGAFSVALPLQDLVAGGSVAGSAVLATAVPGSYGAKYRLLFSDDTSLGASQSQLKNTLTLDVQGTVPAVPEPGTWALLSVGLLALAFRRRST